MKPHVTAEHDGTLCFEWWSGARKLTVYGDGLAFLVDGEGCVEGRTIQGPEDFSAAWRWLEGEA